MSVDQDQLEAPPAEAPVNGVGTLLRQAREERGQDLESVARALRIRHPYLVAIEEGRYRDLPGAPYASGFVRSYAEFLGLDAPEILRRFREESGGLGGRTELVFPAPVSEGGFPAAVLIGLVIILAAVIYGVWYFYQWRHSSSAESVSELPDRLTALIHAPGGEDRPSASDAQASPTPEPSSSAAATTTATPVNNPASPAASPAPATNPAAPAPATAAATPPAASQASPAPAAASAPAPQPAQPQTQSASQPAGDSDRTESVADATPPPTVSPPAPGQAAPPAPDLGQPSRVVLRANDDCWIEIRDPTGAIVSSRLLRKGDTYPVPPRPGLTLTVGNAGALTLLLDGAALPPLGKSGMVRHDIALDPDRVGTPAATANPPTSN